MSDIVERLRQANFLTLPERDHGLYAEAADEIERLRRLTTQYGVDLALSRGEIESVRADCGNEIERLRAENVKFDTHNVDLRAEIERLKAELRGATAAYIKDT